MASNDTTGTARDIIGPLTDIARAIKAQHQALESGRLIGPVGPTGATGPAGPIGPTGPSGISTEWYSYDGSTYAYHSPLRVVNARGIDLLWTAGSSTVTIQTNFDVPAGPVPQWYGTDAAQHYPEYITYGRGMELVYDSGSNAITIQTSFTVPSTELYWSDWGSRVSFGSSDTSIDIYTLEMSDATRASQTWAIQLEYEALVIRQSDPTQPTNIRNSTLVTVVYDGSGVASLVTTSEFGDNPYWKWAGGGVPVINAMVAHVSTHYITITLEKSTGGVDCYAKCRVRKCTEWRLDDW
jgi:hypothetical protein